MLARKELLRWCGIFMLPPLLLNHCPSPPPPLLRRFEWPEHSDRHVGATWPDRVPSNMLILLHVTQQAMEYCMHHRGSEWCGAQTQSEAHGTDDGAGPRIVALSREYEAFLPSWDTLGGDEVSNHHSAVGTATTKTDGALVTPPSTRLPSPGLEEPSPREPPRPTPFPSRSTMPGVGKDGNSTKHGVSMSMPPSSATKAPPTVAGELHEYLFAASETTGMSTDGSSTYVSSSGMATAATTTASRASQPL